MIVADASVVVDLLLGPGGHAGDRLAAALLAREAVCAPHLLDAEVGQVIRRYTLRGEVPVEEGRQMLRDLGEIPVRRIAHTTLMDRAFDLRANVTVYDALYLALAEALDVVLLTADTALRDVPGCAAQVEVLASTTA